jgi:hypothetical protein
VSLRRRTSGLLLAAVVLALSWQLLPVSASSSPRVWEGGVVRYFDATDMERTVATAAARWNASGARVRLRRVGSRKAADVIVAVDDARLEQACGRDCLGFATRIGQPSDGPTTVMLAGELGGDPRPLSVWVAAHEFGHVLGLHHRDGNACSLMSEHAFDTSCAPSLAAEDVTFDQLACVPAPADVRTAAGLYGGRPARIDPSCR